MKIPVTRPATSSANPSRGEPGVSTPQTATGSSTETPVHTPTWTALTSRADAAIAAPRAVMSVNSLSSSSVSPPLTGDSFVGNWSGKSIHDFYAFVSSAMPQGLAGDLKPEQYSDIIAYILAANGAKPGAVAFDKNSGVKIGAVADGRIVPAVTGP